MFDQVNDLALAFAKARAAELVTGIDEATRNELNDIISSGLEENIGLDAIADNIREAYAFSEDRADLIARTEVAMANQQGALEGMKLAQGAGVKLTKVWVPDDEACDLCLENGDDGAIGLQEQFSSGDDVPPAHPSCRCSVASEVEEDSDETEESE
jgi:SPP1 gp7 family putative phage head morphogenesis protein